MAVQRMRPWLRGTARCKQGHDNEKPARTLQEHRRGDGCLRRVGGSVLLPLGPANRCGLVTVELQLVRQAANRWKPLRAICETLLHPTHSQQPADRERRRVGTLWA